MWIEFNVTDDMKVDTTHDAACDCFDFWDYVIEGNTGCEVKSGWNASRCHVHSGTACGSLVSLVATEARIWIECILTEETRMWYELQIDGRDEG